MKKVKLFTMTLIISVLVISQFAMAAAAPSLDEADSISGTVYSVSLVTDDTGVTVVEITLIDAKGDYQTVRVSEETAYGLGLLEYDADGNLIPVAPELWPESISIPEDDILPDEEDVLHPVASALAAYFSEIPGIDYDVIMTAHESGFGFGVIAQALWLTQKMNGDAEVLAAILEAKKTGDYSAFTLEDGTVPTNWGQFKKAVFDGDKKNNLGVVMSGKDKDKVKDKVKSNNGNTGNNSNNGNHGNNGNNGNNADKEKKEKKP